MAVMPAMPFNCSQEHRGILSNFPLVVFQDYRRREAKKLRSIPAHSIAMRPERVSIR